MRRFCFIAKMKDEEMNSAVGITKQHARQQCLKTAVEWTSSVNKMVPRRGEVGLRVHGSEFFSVEQCEDIISKTEALRRGLKPPEDESLAVRWFGWYGGYWVYRVSDCSPLNRHRAEPKAVDVLEAIFRINRSAKRYGEAACSAYEIGCHVQAKGFSSRKRSLYMLKDSGIVAAFRAGRVSFDGVQGGWATYRGEGYCFHSDLIPEMETVPDMSHETPLVVVRRGIGDGMVRLCDAVLTLSGLPDDTVGFRRLPRRAMPCLPRITSFEFEDDNNGYEQELYGQGA